MYHWSVWLDRFHCICFVIWNLYDLVINVDFTFLLVKSKVQVTLQFWMVDLNVDRVFLSFSQNGWENVYWNLVHWMVSFSNNKQKMAPSEVEAIMHFEIMVLWEMLTKATYSVLLFKQTFDYAKSKFLYMNVLNMFMYLRSTSQYFLNTQGCFWYLIIHIRIRFVFHFTCQWVNIAINFCFWHLLS